jgi:isopenicillin-N epimerase
MVAAAPSNDLWGDDWDEVRANWILDPAVAFLNHGSFGATPRPVLDRQLALRTELEREPVSFLWRRLPDLAAEARSRVGGFLGADPDGVVFVTNATTGVNTVLASLVPYMGPGDRVIATDHAYPAVRNAVLAACARSGASLDEMTIAMPFPSDADILAAVDAALTGRARLMVIDHVSSSTAAIFPVARIVERCRSAGVPVLVDAAHAPGMLPVDVAAVGADYWTGNLHKWVCAPKGSAVLWVAPEHRDDVHPLVTSHGAGQGYRAEFDWCGTFDPTPYLAVPAALGFMEGLGWERVTAYNRALAMRGRDLVATALGTGRQVDDERTGSMSVVELPPGAASTFDGALAIQERLFSEHRVEVPVTWWRDRAFVRMSAQVYNAPADYERLAGAIRAVLWGQPSDT